MDQQENILADLADPAPMGLAAVKAGIVVLDQLIVEKAALPTVMPKLIVANMPRHLEPSVLSMSVVLNLDSAVQPQISATTTVSRTVVIRLLPAVVEMSASASLATTSPGQPQNLLAERWTHQKYLQRH